MMDQGKAFLRWLVGVVMGIGCTPTVAFGQAASNADNGPGRLGLADDGTYLTVRLGGKLVVRYRYGAEPFKPYVAELRLPDGRNLLRDSPHDHKHHHGLMFAWNVDGVEFWGEAGQVGRQVHRRFRKPETGPKDGLACIAEDLDWIGPDGKKVLLRERRKILIYADAGPADRLITWESEFAGADPKRDVTITGRKYFGLGARFPVPMDKGSRFVTADGETQVKRVDGSESRWCAITGNVAPSKPITLAMLDDPGNPRHPAKWFAMDRAFAYLSATIGLEGNPFVLKAGQRVVLRYGVAVWAKPVKADRVEQTYRAWRKRSGPRR